MLDRALDCLDRALRTKVEARLAQWLADQLARIVPVLPALAAITRDPAATPDLRVVAAALEATGGITPRLPLRTAIEPLAPDERRRLRTVGVAIGALDLFDARLTKPAAARWRRILLGVRGIAVPMPPTGATVLPRGSQGAVLAAGFRPLAAQAVRVDLVERIARAAHDARAGRKPFAPIRRWRPRWGWCPRRSRD